MSARPARIRTMSRCVRQTAALCLLLLVALLVNAARIQIVEAGTLDDNPANRRAAIARYAEPRGDILVDDRPVTGSKDTGEQLRYERVYRDGPLYAPVTGFSSQLYGTSFLENAEDSVLAGTDPMLAPLPLWHELTRSRSPGGRIATTLDGSAQRAAYDGLAGRKGAVAALEPGTGRVLALVSTPSYDPGRLSGNGPAVESAWRRLNGSPDQPMLNRAIRQTYPPGSTFKVVTAAAALETGTVRDLDDPTDSPDPYRLPGSTSSLTNEVDGCEDASLRYAFTWSCNTVLAKLGTRVGLAGMTGTAEDFGFNDRGLRIPSPVAASNFDRRMDKAQLALSSVGQFDTRATPLQMAMVAAAVAGGGTVRTPYLVDRATTHDGGPVHTSGSRVPHQAMNARTATQLRELMTEVVENGTGGKAAIPGATVGGKTGTAQHGVGNTGTPYAWFISWAHADGSPEPAVAVAVVVEDASAVRGEISGGGDAAPIARAVMGAVLDGRDREATR
ncbi:penicillin-binding transpeptidase domain-containing protein [Streptomyces uncialis]|uniref:penicillin-binding transpeptidase domain-containing protein n=1 Tax=Streptomyces uncialis TaxID=1048205 RepID=UPI0037F7BA9B